MHHLIGTIIIGVLAGGMAGQGNRFRPALRGIVKGGLAARRKIEAVSHSAKAEMEKLVEEARADLDRDGTEQSS